MLIFLPNSLADAASNMAVDAALMESVPTGFGLFRHYAWTEPAFTFGYSQRVSEVREKVPQGMALCRRKTGGGIVDHRDDWTYTLVLSAELGAVRQSASVFYQRLHEALTEALGQQEIPVRLAPCPKKCASEPMPTDKGEAPTMTKQANQCFLEPVAYDVLNQGGAKIAGAALKRSRNALLVQGSIARAALPTDCDFIQFAQAFYGRLSHKLAIPLGEAEDLRPLFDGARIESLRKQFASPEWNALR